VNHDLTLVLPYPYGEHTTATVMINCQVGTLALVDEDDIGRAAAKYLLALIAMNGADDQVEAPADLESRVATLKARTPEDVQRRQQLIREQAKVGEGREPEDRQKVLEALARNHEAFALEEHEMGCCNLEKVHIDTGDAAPESQPLRPIPLHIRPQIEEEVQKMLDTGVIQESHSEWSSPIVPVRKKDLNVELGWDEKSGPRTRTRTRTFFQAGPSGPGPGPDHPNWSNNCRCK